MDEPGEHENEGRGTPEELHSGEEFGPMPLSMPPFTSIGAAGEPYVAPDPPGGPATGGPAAGGPATGGPAAGEPATGEPAAVATPPAAPPRRRRALVGAVAAAALVAGGVGAALGAGLSSDTAPVRATGTAAPRADASQIATEVDPAVVDITTTIATDEGTEEAAGTGMIISSSGLVLTNNHVVDGATSISVAVQGTSRSYAVKVLGVDPSADVALLQLEGASGLATVHLANSSSVVLGNAVVAIGNALGLGHQPSVVTGAVTALDRTISASDEASSSSETLHGLIEMNAAIVPGDSGGPLVNAAGAVIGMDTAAASVDGTSTTIGFAIPIDTARSIAERIEAGTSGDGVTLGASAFLGVIEEQNSFSGSTSTGVPIAQVVPNSAAANAGITAGDTIVSVDGTAVTTITELHSAIAAHAPGSKITIGLLDTSGQSVNLTVTLGSIVA